LAKYLENISQVRLNETKKDVSENVQILRNTPIGHLLFQAFSRK